MSTGTDDAEDAENPGAAGAARGGAWLTYRYRFGGAGTAEATGTMKAPSFRSAARRVLARGLADAIGPEPAYLRLRAAGEQEVLLRIVRTHADVGGGLHLEVVPGDTYRFVPPPGSGDVESPVSPGTCGVVGLR